MITTNEVDSRLKLYFYPLEQKKANFSHCLIAPSALHAKTQLNHSTISWLCHNHMQQEAYKNSRSIISKKPDYNKGN